MCDSLDAVYEENDLSNIETDNQIRKMFARASAIRPVILDSIQKKQLAFKSLSDSSQTSQLSTPDPPEDREKKSTENPFLQYGVAIENFFKLECYLIVVFFWLTVLSFAQMGIFASYKSNSFFIEDKGFMAEISFASLG